uniref:DUF7027 domain-containing protein n=1 Tax=Plectus sambesii TaxID=2011161 RepID=A0A914WDB3_9BILA
MNQVQPRFDPDNPKYICCCGCHVMTGAKILASLSTIGAVLSAIAFAHAIPLLGDPQKDTVYWILLVSMSISLIVGTAVLGCLWYGLIKEREGFLIPTLVCSVIFLVLSCVSGGNLFVSGKTQEAHANYIALLIGSAVCSFGLQYWFFTIYKNAYIYIKNKRWSPQGDYGHVRQSEKVYIAEPKENAEA